MFSLVVEDFAQWRAQARLLIANNVHPQQIIWNDTSPQQALFSDAPPLNNALPAPTIPKPFVELAETVAHHRHPERWNLLYHTLWRLTHGEKNLLHITTDPLTYTLLRMSHAVRRDAHKTKAFVRFRQSQGDDGQERYIAWHRPDHYVLPIVAPFFQRRFSSMQWSILTPDQSVWWDGVQLHYGDGVPEATIADDRLEDLWRNYYRAIFNPARVSVSAMKREMPVRHWPTLPEASIIAELLKEAPKRVEKMIEHYEGSLISAADFLPETRTLDDLHQASQACEGCPLYKCASQTVFGEGPADAKLMLVGEQPGDEEDKAGRPFIGPAGEVLNRALNDIGVNRSELYITNAVKHFKFQQVGRIRHHRTPSLKEITGCKPWLEAEITAVKPERIVCLGVSAARSLIHPSFTLKDSRGEWTLRNDSRMLATYHPSAILRSSGEKQAEIYQAMVADLAKAVKNAL